MFALMTTCNFACLPAYWAASRAASTAICFTTSTAVLMVVLHVWIKQLEGAA